MCTRNGSFYYVEEMMCTCNVQFSQLKVIIYIEEVRKYQFCFLLNIRIFVNVDSLFTGQASHIDTYRRYSMYSTSDESKCASPALLYFDVAHADILNM